MPEELATELSALSLQPASVELSELGAVSNSAVDCADAAIANVFVDASASTPVESDDYPKTEKTVSASGPESSVSISPQVIGLGDFNRNPDAAQFRELTLTHMSLICEPTNFGKVWLQTVKLFFRLEQVHTLRHLNGSYDSIFFEIDFFCRYRIYTIRFGCRSLSWMKLWEQCLFCREPQ